ncbi:hypothetical protein O6H91_04G028400 [Diphasiastrum complanatum]|uniref:Uncharacterized protein n=1 Tax=Diphasiastrum complanatum TaxID=34168 RepID=A0ACC2DV72_DIPCM|nr:hypothetical protein O6H91_04G028400 [Diphasiastrum complanatum]
MQGGSSRWRRILRLIVKALGDAAHSEEQWRSYRSLCDGFSRERGPVPCRHSAGTGFLIGKLLNQGSNSRPVRPSIMMQQVRDAKVLGSDVKQGFIIERKGRLLQVLKTQHTQQGRGGATIQVELRDLQNGLKSSERLRTSEAIEKAYIDEKVLTFLYDEGENATLMDPSSYEQIEVPKKIFGTGAVYLTDGMAVTAQIYEGSPLSANVPTRVTCTVIKAEPYMKGETQTPTYKRVVLENGQQIMAPPFIVAGDRIVVDTTNNTYITRTKNTE